MPVVIRLARVGTKHAPKYRITVADSRRYVKSKYIEILGYYNPKSQGRDEKIVIDMDKTQDWIKKGAQPSDRVKTVMKLAQQQKT